MEIHFQLSQPLIRFFTQGLLVRTVNVNQFPTLSCPAQENPSNMIRLQKLISSYSEMRSWPSFMLLIVSNYCTLPLQCNTGCTCSIVIWFSLPFGKTCHGFGLEHTQTSTFMFINLHSAVSVMLSAALCPSEKALHRPFSFRNHTFHHSILWIM